MNILYVSSSPFPEGTAYSTRILGICKALQSSENRVFVLTDSVSSKMPNNVFDGIQMFCGSNHLTADRTRLDYWTSHYTMLIQLTKILKYEHIDCIISSSMYRRFSDIRAIAEKKHIPLILESCEWFDENNWKKGKNDKEYKRYVKAWEADFLNNDGVIAISRMLKEHFDISTPYVLRLPTIMNVLETEWNPVPTEGRIRLLFIGSIVWGKDRIKEIVNAVERLGRPDIELHIYGPTKKEVEAQLGEMKNSNAFRNNVFLHRKVPHTQLMSEIRYYDLGVIIRPDRRQSNAGFPTKLAEYMSCGIPVIANDTGDIELYLHTNENGYLLPKNVTVDEIINVLETYYCLPVEQKKMMRKNARIVAEENFDYRTVSCDVKNFVNEVITKKKQLP